MRKATHRPYFMIKYLFSSKGAAKDVDRALEQCLDARDVLSVLSRADPEIAKDLKKRGIALSKLAEGKPLTPPEAVEEMFGLQLGTHDAPATDFTEFFDELFEPGIRGNEKDLGVVLAQCYLKDKHPKRFYKFVLNAHDNLNIAFEESLRSLLRPLEVKTTNKVLKELSETELPSLSPEHFDTTVRLALEHAKRSVDSLGASKLDVAMMDHERDKGLQKILPEYHKGLHRHMEKHMKKLQHKLKMPKMRL